MPPRPPDDGRRAGRICNRGRFVLQRGRVHVSEVSASSDPVAPSAPIRVLAVEDGMAANHFYSRALGDSIDIEFEMWLDHKEALETSVPWSEFDVVLLDLGNPRVRWNPQNGDLIPNEKNPDGYDEFPGFEVAHQIRQVCPRLREAKANPYIAAITALYGSKHVRHRARLAGTIDAFYSKDVVVDDPTEGAILRNIVRAAAEHEMYYDQLGDIPEPGFDKAYIQDLARRLMNAEDLIPALEAGVAEMKRIGTSMDVFLNPSPDWSHREWRTRINPVTDVVKKFSIPVLTETGIPYKYPMNYTVIARLYREFYSYPS